MFLHIPRAHEQAQLSTYGFMSEICLQFRKKFCISEILPGQGKNLIITVSVFLWTLQLSALLLKSFRLCSHCCTLQSITIYKNLQESTRIWLMETRWLLRHPDVWTCLHGEPQGSHWKFTKVRCVVFISSQFSREMTFANLYQEHLKGALLVTGPGENFLKVIFIVIV